MRYTIPQSYQDQQRNLPPIYAGNHIRSRRQLIAAHAEGSLGCCSGRNVGNPSVTFCATTVGPAESPHLRCALHGPSARSLPATPAVRPGGLLGPSRSGPRKSRTSLPERWTSTSRIAPCRPSCRVVWRRRRGNSPTLPIPKDGTLVRALTNYRGNNT